MSPTTGSRHSTTSRVALRLSAPPSCLGQIVVVDGDEPRLMDRKNTWKGKKGFSPSRQSCPDPDAAPQVGDRSHQREVEQGVEDTGPQTDQGDRHMAALSKPPIQLRAAQ